MTPLRLSPRPGETETDVVALGENSLDLVATAAMSDAGRTKRALSRIDFHVGGQSATAAVACARLGHRARYIGAMGDDEWGTRIRAELARDRVDVRAVERRGVPTRSAVIVVEPDGERVVYEHCDPRLPLSASDLARDLVVSGRVLLVDATSAAASREAARMAREAGVPVLVDVDRVVPGVETLLDEIDVIVAPEPFVREWSGEEDLDQGLARMARRFARAAAVVVTRGPAGSIARVGDSLVRAPGFSVPVLDTTGAGDAFRGGFASAWIRLGPEASLERILQYSNATAALNCRAVGAQTGLPSWDEVERIVTSQDHGRSN
jgi:sulfofructose kinase